MSDSVKSLLAEYRTQSLETLPKSLQIIAVRLVKKHFNLDRPKTTLSPGNEDREYAEQFENLAFSLNKKALTTSSNCLTGMQEVQYVDLSQQMDRLQKRQTTSQGQTLLIEAQVVDKFYKGVPVWSEHRVVPLDKSEKITIDWWTRWLKDKAKQELKQRSDWIWYDDEFSHTVTRL